MAPESITLTPIGIVASPRENAVDDFWGATDSTIIIDSTQFGPDVIEGLAEFSHLEVAFFFHKVAPSEIHSGARHPRGITSWPKVGIFAQRGKARPNRIGISRCRLIGVDGMRIAVSGLDAIDGTPVLDVKPYMAEFGPLGDVHQPEWSRDVMKDYYRAPTTENTA